MTREEIIKRIIECGQSIIDNADKIANSYEYGLKGTTITCCDVDEDSLAPYIEVTNRFYPESFVKRYL